jgi:hypothetical protein
MTTAADNNLRIVEQELRFIGRHSNTIEGGCGADFEAMDEINMAVESALRALHEYQLSLQPLNKDAPASVPLNA